jgi:Chromosome segregation protein Csm1/Pcs1
MPQLDANRDRALMDILPDYLEEELTFPRESASRFYARVVGVLSKKHEEE